MDFFGVMRVLRNDMFDWALKAMVFGMCGFLATGCHTSSLTEPKRTASELLLLSHSADHALEEMEFDLLLGQKVFVDPGYFDSVDASYVMGAIREKLAEEGAVLVASADKAQYIVEPRNRGLGLDTRTSLVGIPAMDIPIPLAGRVESPELALFKAQMADSIASFALAVYKVNDGLQLMDSQEGDGRAKFNQYQLLGLIKWRSTGIPELLSTSAEVKKRLKKKDSETKAP
jgi:hypothetical protein